MYLKDHIYVYNQWHIYKKYQEIKKELFNLFENKGLFKKTEYELYESCLTDVDFLKKKPYDKLKTQSIEEIGNILNEIIKIKNRIENDEDKEKYQPLLNNILNLYEDYKSYKEKIK